MGVCLSPGGDLVVLYPQLFMRAPLGVCGRLPHQPLPRAWPGLYGAALYGCMGCTLYHCLTGLAGRARVYAPGTSTYKRGGAPSICPLFGLASPHHIAPSPAGTPVSLQVTGLRWLHGKVRGALSLSHARVLCVCVWSGAISLPPVAMESTGVYRMPLPRAAQVTLPRTGASMGS